MTVGVYMGKPKKYEGRACPNCGAPMKWSWFWELYSCSKGSGFFGLRNLISGCEDYDEEEAEKVLSRQPMAGSKPSSTSTDGKAIGYLEGLYFLKKYSTLESLYILEIVKSETSADKKDVELNLPAASYVLYKHTKDSFAHQVMTSGRSIDSLFKTDGNELTKFLGNLEGHYSLNKKCNFSAINFNTVSIDLGSLSGYYILTGFPKISKIMPDLRTSDDILDDSLPYTSTFPRRLRILKKIRYS